MNDSNLKLIQDCLYDLAEAGELPSDIKEEKLSRKTSLASLGIDSIGKLELSMELEKRLNINISDVGDQSFVTIGDVCKLIKNKKSPLTSPTNIKNKTHHFQLQETRWPIEPMKEAGLYFFLEPIQELRNGRVVVKGRGEMIMLSSYSYLGLLGHPRLEAAAKKAIDQFSTGTHGVRLLAGTLTAHDDLEKRIARFKKTESAIVYSSGYVANTATISALVKQGDTVICDMLNHDSIIDGCMMSGAKLINFRHNDIHHLEIRLKANPGKNKLVIVDGVFSMDGDIINLPRVSGLCKEYGALLMVDEAHSIGVLGKTGRGIEEHFGLPPDSIDIKMGTLSKTIPSMGGYVAGNKELINFLKHEGRGFIYSAALAPAQVGAALEAFDVIEDEQHRVETLQRNADYFTNGLKKMGFNTLNTETAIVPVICGENKGSTGIGVVISIPKSSI